MLLLECSRLALALFSSALYSPNARGELGQHPYLDAVMQQNDLANPSAWQLPGGCSCLALPALRAALDLVVPCCAMVAP